jgi:hypothetical protein
MLSLGVTDMLNGVPRYVLISLGVAVVLLIGFVFLYLSKLSAQPALRQASGSRVALAIGENFTPSDRFTGFVDENSGASVVIVELPAAAYDQFKRIGDTKGAFEAQGLINVQPLRLKGRTGEYLYLRGEQKTALVDYAKYIMIFPEGGLTIMVTANIPSAALTSGAVSAEEIEMIVRSASVKPVASEAEPLFNLTYLGGFEEDMSLLGTTKGYRLKAGNGAATRDGALAPLFLVAPSLTRAPIGNLGVMAERSFHTIEQVKGKLVVTERDMTIDGLNGIEIVGSGTDAASGEPCLVFQVVLEARHGGYFRLVGLAPEAVRDFYLAEFRKMAASFRSAHGH